MPSSRRERELARGKLERRANRRAARARRQRVVLGAVSAVAALAVVGVIIGLYVAAGSSSKPARNALAAGSSPSGSPNASSGSAAFSGTCTYRPTGQAARAVGTPPAKPPVTSGTETATITTNQGVIIVSLLAGKAPCTVNSFSYLAGKGYYAGTPCHRLTTGSLSVLQCGDPTGSGSGGPGYQYGDENLAGATYRAGTVAMANAGPGTNGSQFFLVYADSQLPPSYTPFGTVTSGLDVLSKIARAGVKGGGSDGAPALPVTIEKITVTH